MCVKECRILIVSDRPEFVNSLMQSWQRLNYEPEFTVFHRGPVEFPESAVVVVADGAPALASVSGHAALAIVITVDQSSHGTGGSEVHSQLDSRLHSQSRLVQIRHGEGWADLAAALAQEAILRAKAVQQVVEAERRLGESEHFAAIGRFITGERHGLANALTSVMGNSELVLMDAAELRDEVRGQLETIHAMSLRMHETLQRLSSLDTEMRKSRGASC
jgi:signal transduction histidine kinase